MLDKRLMAMVLGVALLLAGCNQQGPTASPTPGPSPSPEASPSPEPPYEATLMVYAYEGDIWVFAMAGNSVTRLTSDPDTFHRQPRFISRSEVAYIAGAGQTQKLMEQPVAGGPAEEVFSDAISAFSYSGDKIAYVSEKLEPGADFSSHVVKVYSKTTGSSTEIKDLGDLLGRGGTDVDDISIEFSPDGTKIAVNDTTMHPSGATSLYVLSLDGGDLVAPRAGTYSRWSTDGTKVFFMKIDKGLSPVGWRSLAVPSGVESDLPGTTPGLRLTVFPGGNLLAYDDGGADPSIYLYDLATQEEEKLATDVAGPRFVSDGALLGTRTEPCDPDGGCFVAWDSLGEGLRVFLGAPPIAQSFASSLDADII